MEAAEATFKGERLADFEHAPDTAQYCRNSENFIQYDSYYYYNAEFK
jgi:hypothetical protein